MRHNEQEEESVHVSRTTAWIFVVVIGGLLFMIGVHDGLQQIQRISNALRGLQEFGKFKKESITSSKTINQKQNSDVMEIELEYHQNLESIAFTAFGQKFDLELTEMNQNMISENARTLKHGVSESDGRLNESYAFKHCQYYYAVDRHDLRMTGTISHCDDKGFRGQITTPFGFLDITKIKGNRHSITKFASNEDSQSHLMSARRLAYVSGTAELSVTCTGKKTTQVERFGVTEDVDFGVTEDVPSLGPASLSVNGGTVLHVRCDGTDISDFAVSVVYEQKTYGLDDWTVLYEDIQDNEGSEVSKMVTFAFVDIVPGQCAAGNGKISETTPGLQTLLSKAQSSYTQLIEVIRMKPWTSWWTELAPRCPTQSEICFLSDLVQHGCNADGTGTCDLANMRQIFSDGLNAGCSILFEECRCDSLLPAAPTPDDSAQTTSETSDLGDAAPTPEASALTTRQTSELEDVLRAGCNSRATDAEQAECHSRMHGILSYLPLPDTSEVSTIWVKFWIKLSDELIKQSDEFGIEKGRLQYRTAQYFKDTYETVVRYEWSKVKVALSKSFCISDSDHSGKVCALKQSVLGACAQLHQEATANGNTLPYVCKGDTENSIEKLLADAVDVYCGVDHLSHTCDALLLELDIEDEGRFMGSSTGIIIVCVIAFVLVVIGFSQWTGKCSRKGNTGQLPSIIGSVDVNAVNVLTVEDMKNYVKEQERDLETGMSFDEAQSTV